jgi:PKD repeat protein
MKNIFIMALAIFAMNGQVCAGTISQQTAQTVATIFFKTKAPSNGNAVLTATLNHTQTEADGIVDFYVFDISPVTGFVIVSADDNSVPIIAYSTEGHFNANAQKIGVSYWMNHTAQKLHYAILNNIQADTKIKSLWNSYRSGTNSASGRRSAAVTIGPLLTTNWNQEPYYNSLCPFNSTDNQRCVTGCVATAMAQIMKYWNYPAVGNNSSSYVSGSYGTLSANYNTPFNWAAMRNSVTSNTDPVDTLMYQCGVSVNMNYNDDRGGGSGAFVLQSDIGAGNPCSQSAFVNYFKYDPNTIQGVYMNAYNTADWITLMENELNAGRVIQYEGFDPNSGGHTWVCDGYDANDMLHMNWGWGGADNGYYSVNNLNAGAYTFSQNDAALIGIQPLSPIHISLSVASQTICPNSNTTLTANGPTSATYSWTPVTGLSCSSCASTIAAPSSTTLYTLTVDSSGVTSSRSLAVIVSPALSAHFSFNAAAYCSLPENVVFTNTSANAISYAWDFGDGNTSTDMSPVHAYTTNGDYSISLITANNCRSDTMLINQPLHVLSGAPSASCENICQGQSVTLTATGGGILSWYDAPVQGNLMLYGSTYPTPSLTNTITYYVASVVTPPVIQAGPVTNAIGGGGDNSFTQQAGMVFNSNASQYLLSVDVYAGSAGYRTFQLQDAYGTVLDSATANLHTGFQNVSLSLSVPAASNLVLTTAGNPDLYYNFSTAAYPYHSSDGSVQITGNNTGIMGAYYYFYNWKFQQPACSSPLTPVTVYVLGTGGGSIVATGTGSPTVSFAPGDTNATTYTWDFGDGSTSTLVAPTHNYTTGGIYTVKLIVSNGSCSDTTTKSISTVQLGLAELNALSTFSVYPNPARGKLSISVNSTNQASGCQIKVNNILGQNEYANTVNLMSGPNQFSFDISALATGVYIVSMQSGKDIVTTRFVKESE